MVVIVFEGTNNVYGPFKSTALARKHLVEANLERVGESLSYMNGDIIAHIKRLRKPRKTSK